MNLRRRMREVGSRGLVVLAAGVALLAPADADAVFACLPSRNCQGVEQCCKKPLRQLALQVARASVRRDFYRSQQNRDDAFKKGAWDSTQHMERAFKDYVRQNQERIAKERAGLPQEGQYDDVPDLTTKDDCKTYIDASGKQVSIKDIQSVLDDPNNPLTKANVCKEAVAAAIMHEDDHQDRCELKKAGKLPSKGGGWARGELEAYADDEAEAYAREAETLRRYRRQAAQRCTTAKKLAANDFKNAQDRVKALKLMKQPRSW